MLGVANRLGWHYSRGWVERERKGGVGGGLCDMVSVKRFFSFIREEEVTVCSSWLRFWERDWALSSW